MLMRCGAVALLAGIVVTGCGGDDGAEEQPLVSGSVDGEYDGQAFTATLGFATDLEGTPIIGFGDEDIHCGSEDDSDPPPGHFAVVALEDVAVGDYTSLFVNIYINVDDFHGVGAGDASVSLTAVSEETLTGSIAWDYTADDSAHYSLSGSFEVVRCPE
jgi:hypothetical protein